MNKRLYQTNNHHRTTIKSLIMILVLIVGFGMHWTFAASVGDTSFLGETSKMVNDLLNVLSWAWIPIATIAGKFMSNDMIYASWLHMDSYLWQMWNISKNFANFGIAGFLLYDIIKGILKKENKFASTIKKAIVGGILIQMSRFLSAALIDIGTITTTAVGSLPTALLSEGTLGTKMNDMIDMNVKSYHLKVEADGKIEKDNVDIVKDNTSTEYTKRNLMPKPDSVSGPLMFIGAATLNIQDMMTINADAKKDAKSVLINLSLKGVILIFYVIILVLLLIANVMRVGYLWIFIATSPLVLLMTVLGDKRDTGLLKDNKFLKEISLKNFVMMVFKPTIFVAVLGVILICIVSMSSILNKDVSDINGVSITQNSTEGTTKMEIKGVTSITTNEKVLGGVVEGTQSIVSNLVIYLVTLFLMRMLVKTSLTGSDPIGNTMKSSLDTIEKSAKNIPLYDGLGYNQLQKRSEGLLSAGANAAAQGMFGDSVEYDRDRKEFKNSKFDALMNEIRGTKKGRSDQNIKSLESAATDKNRKFLEETKTLINSTGNWINDEESYYTSWKSSLYTWIKTEEAEKVLGHKFTTKDDLAKEDGKGWKAIHKALGGGTATEPKTEEEFDKIDYASNAAKKNSK